MLLKNNTKSVQQFSLNSVDSDGVVTPRFLQIPAKATVEITDKDWTSLTSGTVRVQAYESTQEPIGTEELGQAKIGKDVLESKVKVPTGVFKDVNLTLQMVKEGRLIVVEAPKTGLSEAQMVARINLVKGLSVDEGSFSKSELEELYTENLSKINEARKAKKA